MVSGDDMLIFHVSGTLPEDLEGYQLMKFIFLGFPSSLGGLELIVN